MTALGLTAGVEPPISEALGDGDRDWVSIDFSPSGDAVLVEATGNSLAKIDLVTVSASDMRELKFSENRGVGVT